MTTYKNVMTNNRTGTSEKPRKVYFLNNSNCLAIITTSYKASQVRSSEPELQNLFS